MIRGWNTWDARGINRIVNLDLQAEVLYTLYDRKANRFVENFGVNVGQPLPKPEKHPQHTDLPDLGKVREVGARDARLSSASVTLQESGGTVDVAMSVVGDNLLLKITPDHLGDSIRSYVIVALRAGAKGQMDMAGDTITGKVSDGCFAVASSSPIGEVGCFSKSEFVGQYLKTSGALNNSKRSSRAVAFLVPNDSTVRIVVAQGDNTEAARNSASDLLGRFDDAARQAAENTEDMAPIMDAAGLEGAVDAMTAAINWNLSWSPHTGRVYVPVCKSWVEMIEKMHNIKDAKREGPLNFAWDSAFSALILSSYSPNLAREVFEDLLAGMRPDGRLPQLVVHDKYSDRSNPPVFALVGLKIYLKTGDKAFLNRIYPKLRAIYSWFKVNRDRNQDLLMEWGGDPDSDAPVTIPGREGAIHESGMDDSPMWDDAEMDPKHYTLDMACVDLSSLHALSAKCLSFLASEAGDEENAHTFMSEYSMYKDMIDKYLWDSNRRMYMNRMFDGKFSVTMSPTAFYPMIASIPAQDKALRLIREHLMNPEEFWGDMVIPTVPKNHTAFDGDGDYWRGRIWPPLNYLVHHGMMNYDRVASSELAFKSCAILAREWREMRHAHENYSVETGWGEPKPSVYARSCRLYTWSGLMALTMIEEMIDVCLDGGLAFGCMSLPYDMSISGVPMLNSRYDVKTGPTTLEVFRDDEELMTVTPAADVRNYIEKPDSITMKCCGQGPTKFSLRLPFEGDFTVAVGGAEAKGFKIGRKAEFNAYLTDEPTVVTISRNS